MDAIELTGVVLLVQPIGEYDRRVVILTRERGKITAFARGARRVNSPLMAATSPFVFGRFTLYEGRNAYTLTAVSVTAYFNELSSLSPGVYYGFYFLELAAYYGQEGMMAEGMVNLLYVTFRAIIKNSVPLPLLRRIYECRLMAENGEFALPDETEGLDGAATYALGFVAGCPIAALYSFSLSGKAEADFASCVKKQLARCVDRKMKSLEMLTLMAGE